MFTVTTPLKLKTRKIITDLALRSGSADSNSPDPYYGLNKLVSDKLHNNGGFVPVEKLFSDNADFDADMKQPHYDLDSDYEIDLLKEHEEYEIGPKFNPHCQTYAEFTDYKRRLEDIAQEYIDEYMQNLIFSIRMYTQAGLKEYNRNHMVQPTLADVESDEAISLADLLLTNYDADAWNAHEIAEAKEKITYTMKRLHNMSILSGVHILSFIAAYSRASVRNRNNMQNGSTSYLKRNDVISEGFYMADKYGNPDHLAAISNKNPKVNVVFDWLNDLVPTNFISYRQDAENFRKYCRILNIDIENDDMKKYTAQFISRLEVSMLTPNSQYISQIYNNLLQNTSMFVTQQEDPIDLTIAIMRDLRTENKELVMSQNNMTLEYAEECFEYAKDIACVYVEQVLRKPFVRSKCEYINGFLHYDSKLLVLGTGLISKVSFNDPRFLISELGYCVTVVNSDVIHAMHVLDAHNNMRDIFSKNISTLMKWLVWRV